MEQTLLKAPEFIAAKKENKKDILVSLIPLLGGYLFLTLILLANLIKILALNNGVFIYTLDDAYIHLSLAENIINGHYGVNLGEFSSVSSSILWPFLLAPFAQFELAPLFINILAAFATVWVYHRILQQLFAIRQEEKAPFIPTLLLVLLILSTDLIGLVFTGMEHSLQVLVVAVIAWGLILACDEDRARPWLWVAVAAAPLIRYENLAVSAAALFFLILNRQYRKSLLVAGFIIAALGGFSLFLLGNGQEALPASVLAKSGLATEGFAQLFTNNFLYNVQTWFGVTSILIILFLVGISFFARLDSNRRRLAMAAILAVGLHLVAGRVGWYRYEIYILTFITLIAIDLAGSLVAPKSARPGWLPRWGLYTSLTSVFLIFSNLPFIMLLAYVPVSSNNVYNQQVQMHRFVTQYHPGPVAVNDIGFLTYNNDAYVLDLYGLTSLEAFRYRSEGEPDNWMDILCSAHEIDLVMIYEDWYPDIPDQWIKVGELVYSGRKVTISHPAVAFFATSASARAEIGKDLQAFIPTLPEESSFVFTP